MTRTRDIDFVGVRPEGGPKVVALKARSYLSCALGKLG